MGHRLSKITTRTGDAGETGLADGSRVPKDSPRIAALGEVDELNSALGVLLRRSCPRTSGLRSWGSSTTCSISAGSWRPGPADDDRRTGGATRSARGDVQRELAPLKEFILPGGTRAAALAHLARTVCRRAERSLVALARAEPLPGPGRVYLNRLSDLLVHARPGAQPRRRRRGRAVAAGQTAVDFSAPRRLRRGPGPEPGARGPARRVRAQGPERAFSRLYETTSSKLFGVALRILRREDWAEDVLQDCYVSIWNHAASYSAGRSAPMTWMTSIVRNRCLDWLRRPNREVSGSTDDDAEDPLESVRERRSGAARRSCAVGRRESARRMSRAARPEAAPSDHARVLRRVVALRARGHMREPLGTVKTWVRRGIGAAEELSRDNVGNAIGER